jgi:hypothetical protein
VHLSDLTNDETFELLHCRLNTIEAFLASSFDGFKQDVLHCLENELESSGATAAQKKKIMDKMNGVASKHPARRKK